MLASKERFGIFVDVEDSEIDEYYRWLSGNGVKGGLAREVADAGCRNILKLLFTCGDRLRCG